MPNELQFYIDAFDDIHDFSLQILPNLIGNIFTFETQEAFIDIGTPEAYSRANRIDFV